MMAQTQSSRRATASGSASRSIETMSKSASLRSVVADPATDVSMAPDDSSAPRVSGGNDPGATTGGAVVPQ